MKKLAFLVPQITNCGPLNVVLNNIVCMQHNDIEISIITLRDTDDLDYFNLFYKILEGRCYVLNAHNSIVKKLQEIVIENRFDIIHSHGYYPDKYLSKIEGVKKISTIHSMFYKDYPQEYGYLKGVIAAFLHYRLFRHYSFDSVVGCSDTVTNCVIKNTNISNVSTIHNGVDQNKFYILNENKKKYLRDSEGYQNKKIFVYAGRFIRRKRVPELIKWFIENSSDDSILLLLGSGPEREDCEKISNDKIIFIGEVADPEKYYQIADYVVSNSSAEGYPMSIIEAVSCGCYALLSNISSHTEFLNNNPFCGDYLHRINNLNVDLTNFSVEILSAKNMSTKYLSLYND